MDGKSSIHKSMIHPAFPLEARPPTIHESWPDDVPDTEAKPSERTFNVDPMWRYG